MSFDSLCNLCDLCASVVSHNVPDIQYKRCSRLILFLRARNRQAFVADRKALNMRTKKTVRAFLQTRTALSL